MIRRFRSVIITICSVIVLLLVVAAPDTNGAVSQRLRDVVRILEVRPNRFHGEGLIVGLNATGDGDKACQQFIKNMLDKGHINIAANDLSADNAAVVIVTAEIPAFSVEGSKFDITVSALGPAKSLEGGQLILTPLKGLDGVIYALAQGPVVTGAISAAGEAASTVTNHPTVGKIPSGAILEKSIPTIIRPSQDLHLALNMPDFTTSVRITNAINQRYRDAASVAHAGMVNVKLPSKFRSAEGLPMFWTEIGELRVTPAGPARVVVSARTGTIVVGENVRLSKAGITHGNLTISIKESENVSQPGPFSGDNAETKVTKTTDIYTKQEKGPIIVMKDSTTLDEVAQALNLLGVTPRDLITILQLLKKSGALQCELIIN